MVLGKLVFRQLALAMLFSFFWFSETPSHSAEADYPSRSIRWIVAWPPGGSTDVVARIVAQKVSEILGQAVFIDNRGGAAGMIGMKSGVKAEPDGYTFLVSDSAISSVKSLYGSLPFDPDKDLVPIAMFARIPHIIAVRNDLPVKSVSELIAFAKAKPGSVNFGSGGIASPLHLAGELFRVRTGIEWQHIPYRGAGPAVAALVAGEVDVASPTLSNVVSQIDGGNVRALAVMSKGRAPSLPNVPAMAESGFPDIEAVAYYGLSAPAGIPLEVLKRTSEACIQALQSPDVIEKLRKLGAEPVGDTPSEYRDFIQADMKKWDGVIKDAHIPKQTQ